MSSLNNQEINLMLKNVSALFDQVEKNKYKMPSTSYAEIINYNNMIRNVLVNMHNINQVTAFTHDYNKQHELNRNYEIVYNRDGSSKIIDKRLKTPIADSWEAQYDDSNNISPPCYMAPPSNLTSINRK